LEGQRLWIRLSEEQTAIFDMDMAFARTISPLSPGKWEKDETIPPKTFGPKLRELGFGGFLRVPRTSAGSGIEPRPGPTLVFEALSMGPARRSRRSYRSHNKCAPKICWTALPVMTQGADHA